MTARIRLQHILLLAALLLAAGGRSAAQPADTLRFVLRWEVAEGVHPTADSIGRLSGIAIDHAGNVYVSDIADARIWVFDANGRSVGSIGRRGRGPGEFESPTGVAVGPDKALYVRDANLVSRFTRDAGTGRLTRFDSAFRTLPYSDWSSTRATRFGGDSLVFYPMFNRPDRTERTGWYRAYTLRGDARDSIEVPAFAHVTTSVAWARESASGGRVLRGLEHVPFAPLPTWDITPRGTLLIAPGSEYVVRELDRAGRVLREFRRAVPPTRIPPNERRDSLAALRARLDSVRVPWSQVAGVSAEVRQARVPDQFPELMAVYSAHDGRVWVQRWIPGHERRTVFDVFEVNGHFIGTVLVPRSIALISAPVLSLTDIVAIGVDADTGAHTILRFSAAR